MDGLNGKITPVILLSIKERKLFKKFSLIFDTKTVDRSLLNTSI